MVDRKTDKQKEGLIMCKYCENVYFKGQDTSRMPYIEYIHHPEKGYFLNFYRNKWQLCDEDSEVIMNLNNCPWCGRDLCNDSNTVHTEVEEECHSYAFQLTTFDSDIHNVEITDLFYPNYKSIEECEQALKRLIDEGETGDCAHVFKLVPITSYRFIKHWEER